MKQIVKILACLVLVSMLLPACGSAEPPQLGDFAWIDRDGDGIQDAEEEGLEGVNVSLFTASGDLVAQTESDDSGFYGFWSLAAGEYYLEFVPPERYYDQYQGTDTLVTFRVTLKDEGQNNQADSDVNPDTRRTNVFSFYPTAADLSQDAGFVPLAVEITPTPEGSPTSEDDDDDDGDGNGGGDNGGGDKKVFELGALDDAYVITTAPDSSRGSEETFYLWGKNCYVYLRFPLTDIPTGTNIPYANLHLKIHPNSTAQGLKIWIRMVSTGYTWDQSSLAWNNSPSPDPNAPALIDAVLVPYNGDGSEDVFDVTALVQYAIDQGYTHFEIIIGADAMSDDHSQEWYSSESGKGPVLEVDP